MTTSISTVNAGTSAATEAITKKSTLSTATKSALEALGIAEIEGMTESEARAKVAQAQQQQGAQDNSNQQDSATESEILSEAKTLASLVGVSVSSDEDVNEILDAIGAELEDMLEDAEHNPAILSTVSSYLSQLKSLDSQYDNLQAAQENLYSAMNMVSTNNKISLGLE